MLEKRNRFLWAGNAALALVVLAIIFLLSMAVVADKKKDKALTATAAALAAIEETRLTATQPTATALTTRTPTAIPTARVSATRRPTVTQTPTATRTATATAINLPLAALTGTVQTQSQFALELTPATPPPYMLVTCSYVVRRGQNAYRILQKLGVRYPLQYMMFYDGQIYCSKEPEYPKQVCDLLNEDIYVGWTLIFLEISEIKCTEAGGTVVQ